MSGGTVGVGIAGWGAAGRLMAAAVSRDDRFRLAGIADVAAPARTAAQRETGAPVHPQVEGLVQAAGVDVLYVATPTAHHAAAVAAAAAAGVHVVCEKPLAATLAEARSAIDAAARSGVHLLVGASHSYDAPVRALRRLVEEPRLGALVSVESSCHTDWLRRPRTAADLDAAQGNGLVMRQGAHQFDVLRLVCGGDARSVTGTTFGGARGSEIGFTARVDFATGVVASGYYAGTGGFDSRLQTWGAGELGSVDVEPDPLLAEHFVLPGAAARPRVVPSFGRTIATFERGSAVTAASGLLLFDNRAGAPDLVDVTGEPSGWDAVLAELADVLAGAPAVHSGEWGLGTLEICLAVHESARTGAPVGLRHQVALPCRTSGERT